MIEFPHIHFDGLDYAVVYFEMVRAFVYGFIRYKKKFLEDF